MFETYCKNKGYLLKKWVRSKILVWGRKNVKVKRKKNEISMGDKKCKSQQKKKKKEWNMNHLLNLWKKKKMLQSCLEWRPIMNFWPMYYVLCKEFWEVVLYESYYVSKLYEIYGTFVIFFSFYSLTILLPLGQITILNKDLLIYEIVWSQ